MALYMKIQIAKRELEQIFEDLEKARETIYRCYNKLDELGVVELTNDFPPEETDGTRN